MDSIVRNRIRAGGVMGMFSGVLDHLARYRFLTDSSGRLAVFPFGSRRPGYYVDAADETKIKALVKIYVVAAALINVVGSVAALGFTQALVADERSAPLRSQLEFGLVVYVISALLLYLLPALLLWKVYKGAVTEVCSSLTAVESDSVREMKPLPTPFPAVLILISAGAFVLLVGVALMLLVSHRS
jgi:hypothetical protein